MSRIGNKIIKIPNGVNVSQEADMIIVKGPKGEQKIKLPHGITFEIKDGDLQVSRVNDEQQMRMFHGTTRALLNNAIVGVTEGFKKELELVGIGYRSALRGKDLVLTVGYSHEVVIKPDEGVTITCNTPTEIAVTGISRFAVGQTAARIREVRPPEPYNGKGIKYKGEHIVRKEGKRTGKK